MTYYIMYTQKSVRYIKTVLTEEDVYSFIRELEKTEGKFEAAFSGMLLACDHGYADQLNSEYKER